MKLARISASLASKIDQDLMGSQGFSIDQLMELAGLAVADCVYTVHPPEKGPEVLVLAGPGNNGGDGLVASRHLFLRGYKPIVYYSTPSKGPLFDNLRLQLKELELPVITTNEELSEAFKTSKFVIDSLFGFSFKPPVRENFLYAMTALASTKLPTLAVDIPSSWSVDNGPVGEFKNYMPQYLISLTAPKKSAEFFNGTHYVGGRFISKKFAAEHGFSVPPYEGTSHIWKE